MKIFIIGSGKVARALGMAFLAARHVVTGVAGRNIKTVNALAKKLHCQSYTLTDVPNGSDIYVIAVKDDAISEVAKELGKLSGVVVHTSGSTPVEALGKIKKKGVFYPVQTINSHFKGTFRKVPVCIETKNSGSSAILVKLAKTISLKVYRLNAEQRQSLHLAAVFTNNFTNHLMAIAQNLLAKDGLPFEMVEELAIATIRNAFESGPVFSQTGPAVRNDFKTISRHLAMLKDDKAHQAIYRIITSEISRVYKLKNVT